MSQIFTKFVTILNINIMTQSVEKQIEKSIKSKPKGTLVLLDDYVSYGASKAIQKSLDPRF